MSKAKPIKVDTSYIREQAGILEDTFESFGMLSKVVEVNNHGQEIEYRLRIVEGIPIRKYISKAQDIALALASPTGKVTIVGPIPGTKLVGITVPLAKTMHTKRKKAYQIIRVTKTVKVSEYSMAELLRDTTVKLFMIVSKYSGIIAERVNQVGRKDQK